MTQRRVKRNLDTGLSTLEPNLAPVEDSDICYMLAALHFLRREINPHWWFASSVI